MDEEQLNEAWRQAGRFLHRFAKVESALNMVVKRVLDLEDNKGEFIVSQFDLTRKMTLAAFAIEAEKDRHIPSWVESAKKTIQRLHKINNQRILFAHQPFEPDGAGGVVFNMEGARNKGLPNSIAGDALEESHVTMDELEREFRVLHAGLRPIVDFDALGPLPPPSIFGSGPFVTGILGMLDRENDLRAGRYREGED
jgi:hypothetical protein